MTGILKFLFNIAFGIVQTLFGGFVLSKLWAWFINPSFPGAPRLDYLHCVGLMFVVGFFTSGVVMALGKVGDKDEDVMATGILKSLVMILLVYPVTLLSAYIWHQFIG